MDYYLYHDESKKEGYWHGMLLVPVPKRSILLEKIEDIRENTRWKHVVNFKSVKKKNRVYFVNQAFLYLGIASLIQDFKGQKYPIYLGKRQGRNMDYEFFDELVGAKFILFRERDNLKELSDLLDYGGKIETTMRMGLKGGLHFLGDESNPINIKHIHFDGHEHHGRSIDSKRIVNRIKDLREYCSISQTDNLIDDRSSKHYKENSQSYADCQLLQLTDVLVGSFRYIFSKERNRVYDKLTKPAKRLAERYLQGKARMQNSRWNNSICISQCQLDEGTWNFTTLNINAIDSSNQKELF